MVEAIDDSANMTFPRVTATGIDYRDLKHIVSQGWAPTLIKAISRQLVLLKLKSVASKLKQVGTCLRVLVSGKCSL